MKEANPLPSPQAVPTTYQTATLQDLQLEAISHFSKGSLEYFKVLKECLPDFFAAFSCTPSPLSGKLFGFEFLSHIDPANLTNEQLDIFAYLLDQKVIESSFFSLPLIPGSTFLSRIVDVQNFALLESIFEKGNIDLNRHAQTPLLVKVLEAKEKKEELGKLLLKWGANPHVPYQSSEGITTPFKESIIKRDLISFKLFAAAPQTRSFLHEIFDHFGVDQLEQIAHLILPCLDVQALCEADGNGVPLWSKLLDIARLPKDYLRLMLELIEVDETLAQFTTLTGKTTYDYFVEEKFEKGVNFFLMRSNEKEGQ